jgi:hypothetical protein
MITIEDWEAWLATAPAKAQIIYACAGSLGDKAVTDETKLIAERAKVAFSEGRIELVQRLCKDVKGRRSFEYLAVKKQKIRIPLAGGIPWRPKILGQQTFPPVSRCLR